MKASATSSSSRAAAIAEKRAEGFARASATSSSSRAAAIVEKRAEGFARASATSSSSRAAAIAEKRAEGFARASATSSSSRAAAIAEKRAEGFARASATSSSSRFLTLASLFAARAVQASEHAAGHEEVNWFELGGSAFTFVVFVALILWKAAPAARAFFLNRHEEVKKAVEEAQRAKADAIAKAHEYERKMADIEGEMKKLQATFAGTAEAEKQKMLLAAQTTAKRIEKDAQALIQAELEKAKTALKADAADMAVKLASEILSREIKADDQKRLVGEFMQSLTKTGTQKAA